MIHLRCEMDIKYHGPDKLIEWSAIAPVYHGIMH
jgi:hypothetical protein